MKIFLVCDYDGSVIDVLVRSSFERAYEDSVGKNYGEFLVQLDREALRLIRERVPERVLKRLVRYITLDVNR